MKQADTSQLIWEILNAALYDLTSGQSSDGIEAIEEVIAILESQEVTA
jgi:hypothetical protein